MRMLKAGRREYSDFEVLAAIDTHIHRGQCGVIGPVNRKHWCTCKHGCGKEVAALNASRKDICMMRDRFLRSCTMIQLYT